MQKCFSQLSKGAHSKIHAAYSPLLASAFQAFMWDSVSPAWQSVALPAGKHSAYSSMLPICITSHHGSQALLKPCAANFSLAIASTCHALDIACLA